MNYDVTIGIPFYRSIDTIDQTLESALSQTYESIEFLLIDDDGNNIGIITKGLTQYEVVKNSIMVPILRATGQISNPKNPARTTPAGPPLEVDDLQMIGFNQAEMYIFFGNEKAFYETLNRVYNYVIV